MEGGDSTTASADTAPQHVSAGTADAGLPSTKKQRVAEEGASLGSVGAEPAEMQAEPPLIVENGTR